ncbi:c-type cytochrome [Roseovarius aquimarinus]|uniref:C-type cytochrome n=1 Tax=Roseovarius aquimarinus TaxID=1229156 RepID=A0ABW7I436_9RHOB
MKPNFATATAAAFMLAAPAFAAEGAAPTGDAAAGEEVFAKQCVTCHVVKDDSGELLAGRNGRQGPNLYGVAGAPVAHVEDFKYGKSTMEAAEKGLEWTEENFVGYVQDPTGWLRDVLEDDRARSKMSWKVRDEQDAKDLYAYLHSIGPDAE